VILHVVDGTYELFRAHHSRRPDRTDPTGRDVKATVGMVGSLLALLHDPDERVTHIAVAFDNPIRSFRNELFAGYKDEAGVPEELLAQFDGAEEAVAALGVVVWSMDRHEADDAMATAARRWAEEVDQVRIVTPDKDLAQCVRGRRVVRLDRRNAAVMDEAGVVERFGVGPRSIPDLLALVGDSADGIPGIPGFGAKSAAVVLARYEHIEHIPDDPGAWEVRVRGVERLARTLAERRDDALLYRDLATLRTDVQLGVDLGDLRWDGVPKERFLAWCDRVGVEELRERPRRWSD
jgi:5'-3' exonuclease